MSWTRWLSVFRKSSPAAEVHAGVYPAADFCRVLAEERVRAERTKLTFTLLAFRALDAGRDEDNRPNSLDALVKLLPSRLRLPDRVGWLDRGTLGVVLPATGAIAAVKVADDICRRCETETGKRPAYEIFAYPHTPDHDDSDTGAGTDAEQRVLTEIATIQHTLAPLSADEAPAEQSPDEPTPTESAKLDRAVHSLDELFVRPLPSWKRALDIVGASVGLVLASPILLAAAVAIKLTSPGPIFFSQARTGLGGRRFRMHKFRTMVPNAEALQKELRALNEQDGPAFKIANDPRITPVGRFLRKSSIDELPQLWNVLCGDMSLVGPRPLPCHEADACDGWLRRRLDVTPGLTCIWQVQDQRNGISFDEWTRMDVRYARERSVWNDLKLIGRTASVVLGRKSV